MHVILLFALFLNFYCDFQSYFHEEGRAISGDPFFFVFFFQVFEDVHLDSRPTLKKVLNYLNIVFVVVFTVEFLLKTLGLGFLTYFKNAWNCLDVIIVVVSKEHLKQ